MYEQPSSSDLIAAVREFLQSTVTPALSGHAAFHARVADNALAILEREMALGPEALARERLGWIALLGADDAATVEDLRARAAALIRDGAIDITMPGLLDHLAQTAADRVAIEQPKYASLTLTRLTAASPSDLP